MKCHFQNFNQVGSRYYRDKPSYHIEVCVTIHSKQNVKGLCRKLYVLFDRFLSIQDPCIDIAIFTFIIISKLKSTKCR